LATGKIAWPHGFQLRYITVEPGTSGEKHVRAEEEVLFVQDGALTVSFDGGDVDLEPGDVLTVPVGVPRAFSNEGKECAEVYVVLGGDSPQPARPTD
jgi:mannose-6-phosphate isomerase-like protein (cupin superfamily)